MKRLLTSILIIFLLSCGISYGQGETSSPYSITGWDLPEDSTSNYQLYIYRLLSNPGGWINRNTRKIDSLLNALVVYTDSVQLQIRNDTLIHSAYASGQAAFTTTVQYDTVVITGLDSLDVVNVSVRESIPTSNDILGVFLKTDTLIVGRPALGTSGLKYNWIWMRKYQ